MGENVTHSDTAPLLTRATCEIDVVVRIMVEG